MQPNITQVPRRSSKYYAQTTQAQTRPRAHPQTKRSHWLVGLGTGMLIVIAILFIAEFIVIPSYRHLLDHWTYGGYPVTHIAANLERGGVSDVYGMGTQGYAVVVIVTKGKTEAYAVPLSNVSTSSIVLVSVMDVNGDGKADLVIHVDGTDISTVLFNNGHAFQAHP